MKGYTNIFKAGVLYFDAARPAPAAAAGGHGIDVTSSRRLHRTPMYIQRKGKRVNLPVSPSHLPTTSMKARRYS